MRTEFEVPTQTRIQFIDITAEVQRALRDQRVQDGICHVFVPHTTAAVTINENADPDVARDVLAVLSRLIPHRGDYRHTEGNSDAHARSVSRSPAGGWCWAPGRRSTSASSTARAAAAASSPPSRPPEPPPGETSRGMGFGTLLCTVGS